jgi:D-glycero-alpha-D-manno-heptose-7-phosphate kinase
MIISRTPFRMSFVGGGSDLPAFYRHQPGAVISTAIDKYVYVTINKKFDDGIRIAYSKNEEVSSVDQIEHKLVKAVLQELQISGGIEISTIADIPSKGTGLGSSSSFTVGLLHALNAYKGIFSSSESLGAGSCRIEIDICQEPIGRQDQYAAAYGGFNMMEFLPDDSVRVAPIICEPHTIQQIEQSTLLFYTGITRSASGLLQQQSTDIASSLEKQKTMRNMVALTRQLKAELERNNVNAFGEILHENWLLKKSLTKGISTADIDDWYNTALQAGATGGKILGAGAGGFLMLSAPPDRHPAIKQALHALRPIDVKFEPQGSRIIFYH